MWCLLVNISHTTVVRHRWEGELLLLVVVLLWKVFLFSVAMFITVSCRCFVVDAANSLAHFHFDFDKHLVSSIDIAKITKNSLL